MFQSVSRTCISRREHYTTCLLKYSWGTLRKIKWGVRPASKSHDQKNYTVNLCGYPRVPGKVSKNCVLLSTLGETVF